MPYEIQLVKKMTKLMQLYLMSPRIQSEAFDMPPPC